MCRKPPLNVILNSESEDFLPKISNQAGMATLTNFIHYCTRDFSQ